MFINQIYQFKLFSLVLYGVGVRCDQWRFSMLSPLIEKSMVTTITNYLDSQLRNIRWTGIIVCVHKKIVCNLIKNMLCG